MREYLDFNGDSRNVSPISETPEHIAQLGLVAEEVGPDFVYEAPEAVAPVVDVIDSKGSSSSGKKDANSQYYW